MSNRFIDPMARARSFAARKGGMRDDRQVERRMKNVERAIYGSQSDDSGETPEDWSIVEEVGQLPDPTPDVIGRLFVQRNEGADDTLSVGIRTQDGTPVIIGLTTQSPDDAAVALALSAEYQYAANYTPGGVAIDSSGNLYLTYDYLGSQYIEKRNASLVFQWNAAANGALHVSTDGTNTYVARSSAFRIGKFLNASGAAGSPATIGTTGTGAGQFQEPYGVANDATYLWVTDRTRNRVLKFSLAGTYQSEFGGTGSAQGQFNGPTGITLDASGNIYVCDTGNHRIQKFNSSGTWQATFGGTAGSSDGQLNAPEGIAVDTSGNLWIADTGNHRIQVLDASGVYVAKVGGYGSGSAQLKSPKDIALGSGYGFVIDYGNRRISRVKVAASHTHTNVVTVRTAGNNVLNNANGGATATCNADEVCTGGGYDHNGGTNVHHSASRPSGNGWNAFVLNRSGATVLVTVYANCLKAVI